MGIVIDVDTGSRPCLLSVTLKVTVALPGLSAGAVQVKGPHPEADKGVPWSADQEQVKGSLSGSEYNASTLEDPGGLEGT